MTEPYDVACYVDLGDTRRSAKMVPWSYSLLFALGDTLKTLMNMGFNKC